MKVSSLYAKVKRGIKEYGLIDSEDKVAVGISGGKDSLILLYALWGISKQADMNFSIYPIHINMGFSEFNISPVEDFCKSLGLELKVIDTNIGRLIFEERKEKNPCSLCSKMRRGILNKEIKKLGCNKLALGHHRDDILTTTLLSLFYEAQLKSMSPKSLMDKTNIQLIRPLIYVNEEEIISLVDSLKLPVLESPCPYDKKSKRKDLEKELSDLELKIPNLKNNMFRAIKSRNFLK